MLWEEKVMVKLSKDCGILDIRCIGPSTKNEWRCTVKCSDGQKYGAVINATKDTIKFYSGGKPK